MSKDLTNPLLADKRESLAYDGDPLDIEGPYRKVKVENRHIVAIKKLVIVSFICLFFLVIELVGGILSDSLAILTDAAHMLSDFANYCIGISSICLTKLPAS